MASTPRAVTVKGDKGIPTAKEEFWTNVWVRADLAATLLLDALLIVVAYGVRIGMLWIFALGSPEAEARNWAIAVLEWIADIALVGTALVYTVFDLTKRMIQAFKAMRREWNT